MTQEGNEILLEIWIFLCILAHPDFFTDN